jgi:hypothetical protein
MTHEEYDKSISTGERQIAGFWAKATHYSIVFFFLFFPAVFLCFQLIQYLKGDPAYSGGDELWIFTAPLVLGGLAFWLQKRRLRYKIIQTTLTRAQVEAIIERVADELEWKGHFVTNKIYKAKTSPRFFSGSWGEEITILLPDNRIFINSICDPDKHASLTSFGRNWENKDMVINSIKRAEQIVAKG